MTPAANLLLPVRREISQFVVREDTTIKTQHNQIRGLFNVIEKSPPSNLLKDWLLIYGEIWWTRSPMPTVNEEHDGDAGYEQLLLDVRRVWARIRGSKKLLLQHFSTRK